MINACLKTLYFFFGITFLLNTTGVSHQGSEIIHVKDIPAEGILLDRGWKFKVGDDLMYAQSGYDDSGWESINPTLDIHDSLPQIPEGNVCWLRIRLSIDNTVSQLVMVMQQSVACRSGNGPWTFPCLRYCQKWARRFNKTGNDPGGGFDVSDKHTAPMK